MKVRRMDFMSKDWKCIIIIIIIIIITFPGFAHSSLEWG
jgi:hypothetical protein